MTKAPLNFAWNRNVSVRPNPEKGEKILVNAVYRGNNDILHPRCPENGLQ